MVDDFLVTGRTMRQLIICLIRVFEACLANGITLLAAKVKIGKSVKFARFIMDKDSNKPDPVKVEAFKDFPPPKDITNLKSYLGLANQLGEFFQDLKHSLEPIKPLLSSKNAYVWNDSLQKAFEKSKEVLCLDQLLKRYSPNRHTVLFTDASQIGLRYVVLQTNEKL